MGEMNILVFLKQVTDVKVPLGCDESTGTVRKDWNVPMLNPEDRAAMESGSRIKGAFSRDTRNPCPSWVLC